MTTGSITAGQEKQFYRFGQDLLSQARKQVPLDKDSMQRLIANWDKVMNDVVNSLIKYSMADNRFELLTSFEITVPKRYNHNTQLATFDDYAKKERYYFYNENITDKNFAKATQWLVPGKTYSVKIFGIKQRVTSEDCLAFLSTQQAILVGAQGLSLARQLKKDKFPMSKWTASFDQKDALWLRADGDYVVPLAYRYSDGDCDFGLGRFELGWDDNHCLLCVCDLFVGKQA